MVSNETVLIVCMLLYFIRDIASAIKDVLDAVNELSHKHQDLPKMMEYKKVYLCLMSRDL